MTESKLLNNIINILEVNNASNTVYLTTKNNSCLAKHIIITSTSSTTLSKTLTNKILTLLKKNDKKNIRVDGLEFANWVAINFEDTVIHIFLPEVREYYNIEKIWQ